jgi:thiamine pyrophosphokinase
VAQIYLDEIEELKENLERKEYLLQVNEQKYSEFEKMLMQVADYDDGVRRRLEDMNVVPKDRKISNVVLENAQLKATIEGLKYEVEKIRDQMEQMAT